MVNQAEFDLRIATYNTEVAQRNLPAWQGTAQRAIIPGTLATKVKAMMARVVTHSRHTNASAKILAIHTEAARTMPGGLCSGGCPPGDSRFQQERPPGCPDSSAQPNPGALDQRLP